MAYCNILLLNIGLLLAAGQAVAVAQEAAPQQPADETTAEPSSDLLKETAETAGEIGSVTKKKVSKLAEQVDQDASAQDAKQNVLKPIYGLAERLAFPAFHWIAFAAMVAGLVSFGLQLVLGKLVVLVMRGFSLMEVLSDGLGFFISAVGLVLTTQAASENSNFTASPSMVLSAAVAGVAVGFLLYLSGQRLEIDATRGRTAKAQQKSQQQR